MSTLTDATSSVPTSSSATASAAIPSSQSTQVTFSLSTSQSTVVSNGLSGPSTSITSNVVLIQSTIGGRSSNSTLTPATARTNPGGGKKSTNGGAIAGAAIGGLVFGILIGLLVMFFLRKRRDQDHAKRNGFFDHTAAGGAHHTKEKSSVESSLNLKMGSAAAVIETNLADPAADSQIKDEYFKISQKINDHVLSYYGSAQTSSLTATALVLSNLLGSRSSISNSQVTALLVNKQKRASLLRYAVARIIVAKMDFSIAPESSLLPTGIAQAVGSILKVEPYDGVRMAFFVKWRVITAHLLGKSGAPSNESIRRAVQECDAIIAPFALPNINETDRLKNLEALAQRAARVAELLFSQPAFWNFDWESSGTGLVVFPSLNKIIDDTGKRIHPPVIVEPKEVVAL